MRKKTTRNVNLLIALAVSVVGTGAVAGCGSDRIGVRSDEVRDVDLAPKREARARQVADAWDGSTAADAWREGYHPMADAVQLPENGFRNETDQRAYATQNFVLGGALPAARPKGGEVRWKRGGSLTLPLIDARTAYETLDRNSSAGPHLRVTGAELGEMTLATSRGPATVPAWLFTLKGYDSPLKRAAISPSELPEPPVRSAGGVPSSELRPLHRLVEVAEDGLSVTVVADHGSCDEGPAVEVLESGGSVVLSAYVLGAKKGPCTSEMQGEKVTVALTRPLSDRVLLDAFTGRPVPYGEPNGPSPSWS